jgi:hypothetical protein
MPIDRPRDPLKYEPRFEFDPDAQNYQMLVPSAATIAQDMALAFARDIDGKMRAALIGMGWAPPETARLATEAVRDALEASVRKGVAVHWDVLERQLLAAHDALTKTL